MSWRDRIAKLLAEGRPVRTDLTTPGYHGTGTTFRAFENQPAAKAFMIDRSLGTHIGKDPALASTFAERFITQKPWGGGVEVKGAPNVMPVVIPDEKTLLQAVQPRHGGSSGGPEWRKIMTDQAAIERMAALKAFPQNTDLLERWLMQAHAQPAKEAIANARKLAAGDTAPMIGGRLDLPDIVRQYGGKPYNDPDRQLMTDLARSAWEKEGHKGIRYINTAPMEAGAPGVKDPTSYIVFRPENIRSQFANFDPAKMGSSDLLAGLAGLSAVPVGIGAIADQSRYEAPP